MASVQPESGMILYNVGANFPHLIWLSFSKESLEHIMQKRSGSDVDVFLQSHVVGGKGWDDNSMGDCDCVLVEDAHIFTIM